MIKYIKQVVINYNLINLYYETDLEVYFIGYDPDLLSAMDYNSDLLVLFQNNDIDPEYHVDVSQLTL